MKSRGRLPRAGRISTVHRRSTYSPTTREAAACYQRALGIFQTVGDRWGAADTLTNLGDICRAAGELLHAREAWQQALGILDDLQHPDAAEVRAKLARTDP